MGQLMFNKSDVQIRQAVSGGWTVTGGGFFFFKTEDEARAKYDELCALVQPEVKILSRSARGFTAVLTTKVLTPEEKEAQRELEAKRQERAAKRAARLEEDTQMLDTARPADVEILARAYFSSIDETRMELAARKECPEGVRVVLTQEQGVYFTNGDDQPATSERYSTVWQVCVGDVEMTGSRKALALNLIAKWGYNLTDKYGV